jgi:biotin carboxyl carrier protein
MQLLISYSHRDVKFAQILKRALEKYDFPVWLDNHDMSFGDDIAERLMNEILRSDLVLVVITPDSVQSAWVLWEIEYCLRIERLYKVTKLVPILMSGDSMPSKLAGRVYADFRTTFLMNKNFPKLVEQILKAKGAQALEEPPIEYARINEEVLSAPNQIIFQSPMVGTAHLAPTQWSSKPFVSIGSSVREGDVLLIIEAMKLMNEITAECEGTVAAILIENGQEVEYGQPLFLLDPPGNTE